MATPLFLCSETRINIGKLKIIEKKVYSSCTQLKKLCTFAYIN